MTCGDLRPAELNQPHDEEVRHQAATTAAACRRKSILSGGTTDQKIEGGFHAALID